MAVTYESIAWQQVSGTSTSAVTFSSISSNYTDIVAVLDLPPATPAPTNLFIRVGNGSIDSGSSYYYVAMQAGGGGVDWTNGTSGGAQTAIAATRQTGVSNTSEYMSYIQFFGYKNTSIYKTILSKSGGFYGTTSANGYDIVNGVWTSLNAINTIQFSLQTGAFGDKSTFALYGIKAA